MRRIDCISSDMVKSTPEKCLGELLERTPILIHETGMCCTETQDTVSSNPRACLTVGQRGTKSGLGLQEKMLRYWTQLVHLSLYVAVAAGHDLKYVGYESCSFEKAWKNNVAKWQEDVCKHVPLHVIDGWIKSVKFINSLDAVGTQQYTDGTVKEIQGINVDSVATYLSHHIYEVGQRKIRVPIEPIIGLARDPRKCWDVMVENFTQSKDHMIPKSVHLANILSGTVRNSTRFTMASNGPEKAFLFDAGATYYSDTGSQSTKWIIDWYGGHGVTIKNVVAWEKKPIDTALHTLGVPRWLLPGFEYNNFAIETSPNSKRNPIKVIKDKCSAEDFVVFKLDIDHFQTERAIVHQLKDDPAAMALIDDFYFEQHFTNRAMRLHGWYRLYPVKLTYYYSLALPMREQGFRIHYWP